MMSQRTRAGATLLLALAGIWLGGCAENRSSLFIRQVVAPQGDSATCEYTNSPSAGALFSGVLDAGLALEYRAKVLVGNQIVRRGDENTLRTETSRIQLNEADVTVLDASGASVTRTDGSTAAFTIPISGFVDPGSGSEPGYGLADVLLIDAVTAQGLATQAQMAGLSPVVASVVVRGETLGGNEIESAPWQFPITVCVGCTVVFPPAADDSANPLPDCDSPSTEDFVANCTPGQDLPTDCRSCRFLPVCQP